MRRITKIVLLYFLLLNCNGFGKELNPKYQNNNYVNNVIVSNSIMKSSTHNLTEALHNAPAGMIILTADLINEEPKNPLDKLTAHLVNALNNLMKHATNFSDKIAKDMITIVFEQMEWIKNEVIDLAHNMDEQFDMAVQNLNESLVNHTERIDNWADHLKNNLRTINETFIYKNSCHMVDNLIDKTTNELRKCCNITIKPVMSLCHNFRAVLANSLRVVTDVLMRMQFCLEDKNSYTEFLIPCLNLAYNEVSNLIEDTLQLQHKLQNILPIQIFYSSCCISMVIVKIEKQQNILINELTSID